MRSGSIHESAQMGAGAIVRDGARIGAQCRIGDYAIVEGDVEIAEGVEVAAFCHIRGPVTLGARVRVGSHTCIWGAQGGAITIKASAKIGCQVTIATGLMVGESAAIEAGAVVTRNVPANAVVAGNPAKIVRYHSTVGAPTLLSYARAPERGMAKTTIPGVNVLHMPLFEDLRGNLSVGESGKQIPFEVKRYFLTFEVESEEARGEHAHRTLHQLLICVHGRVHILADDGQVREEFILDRPNVGLHIPPMIWAVQYRFSPGAVLMALCSDFYNPEDYIRDYAVFAAEARKEKPGHG